MWPLGRRIEPWIKIGQFGCTGAEIRSSSAGFASLREIMVADLSARYSRKDRKDRKELTSINGEGTLTAV
jgi:hypothetical protein